MKKLFYMLLIAIFSIFSVLRINAERNFQNSPVGIVDEVKTKANKKTSTEIQNTDLDAVTSKTDKCDISVDSRFTLTRTLCYIQENIKDYLQYIMWLGLTAATIILIRNWFKIVTATDREKQISTFKKSLLYITIWVVLLIWFYYIIELFVSVVNVVTE